MLIIGLAIYEIITRIIAIHCFLTSNGLINKRKLIYKSIIEFGYLLETNNWSKTIVMV